MFGAYTSVCCSNMFLNVCIHTYTYIPYHTIPHDTTPHHTTPYHTNTIPVPYHYHYITIPLPYHTIPLPYHYHTITILLPYHTVPYHTTPYHTITLHTYIHRYAPAISHGTQKSWLMLAFHCCHVGTPDPTGSTQKYLCPTRPGPRQRKTKRKSSGTSFLGGKIGGDQDTPIYGHQNTGEKELSTHFWMKKRKWGVLIFRHNPKFGSVLLKQLKPKVCCN